MFLELGTTSRLTVPGPHSHPSTPNSRPKRCVETPVDPWDASQPPGSFHPAYGMPPKTNRWYLHLALLRGNRGWSGGAMVLGKLPVPGRPTIWITVGQGPTALAVGAGGGCLDISTLIYPFSPLSPSLWETARYRLKYCLKGPLNPKQPTNQPEATITVNSATFPIGIEPGATTRQEEFPGLTAL